MISFSWSLRGRVRKMTSDSQPVVMPLPGDEPISLSD